MVFYFYEFSCICLKRIFASRIIVPARSAGALLKRTDFDISPKLQRNNKVKSTTSLHYTYNINDAEW